MTRILLLVLCLATIPAGAPASGIDPALRSLLSLEDTEARGALALARAGLDAGPLPRALLASTDAVDPTRLEVFLRFEPGTTPADLGVPAVRLDGDRVAAQVDLATLRAWVADGRLAEARLARPVRPALDRSASFIGLDAVRGLSLDGELQGNLGQGVVVGIVDSGADFYHPDFQDGTGSTRFDSYWDQGALAGVPPRPYNFGGEWFGRDIDRRQTPGHRDFSGHGTHVLGIAAGNGRSSTPLGGAPVYLGVAPRATLVGVRTNFTEFGVVAGIDYVFRRAEALGMPAVVNLSLGNHFGPHRGTSPFERAVADLGGPGRLIVAAGGNSGDDAYHAELVLPPDGTDEFQFLFPRYQEPSNDVNYVTLEGWFDPRDRYRFTVLDPAGDVAMVIEPGTEETRVESARGILRAWNTEDLGMGSLLVEVLANTVLGSPASGRWTVRVDALGGTGSGEIDVWLVTWNVVGSGEPALLDHLDQEETVISPGTAEGVLSVGAVATRSCWTASDGTEECYGEPAAVGDAAYFSSFGPTSDGREKPEIMAPGFGVVSTLSDVADPSYYTEEEMARLVSPNGRYWVSQGTSMAAPHATGAAALLLARFPAMTPEQLVLRLRNTGNPGTDQRSGKPMVTLDVGDALAPLGRIVLAELVPRLHDIALRVAVGRTTAPVEYVVYRALGEDAPFHRLTRRTAVSEMSFEVIDARPEAGRLHVYRIAARDPSGLEEDLDTLRIAVPGIPATVLRAPDPNPARTGANVRFYLAPTPRGGEYAVEIFDVRGRLLRTLETGTYGSEGSERAVSWDLATDTGRRVAAGVYTVRLRFDPFAGSTGSPSSGSATKQLVVIR